MSVVILRPDPTTIPATLTDYQRTMYAARAAETVPCPYCEAPVGYVCRSLVNGHSTWTHAKRKQAVAHLTEDEKIAAFCALQAERARRRAEADRELEAFRNDPVKQAEAAESRRWWSEQIARINAEQRAEESDFRSRCNDVPFRGSRSHADGCRCKSIGEVEFTPEFAKARRERERHEALRGTLPVTDLAVARARRAGAR